KAPAGPEQDGCGQNEIADIEPLHGHDAHQPMMEWRIKVPAHFKYKERQGEGRGQNEIALEPGGILVVMVGAVVRWRVDGARGGGVASLGNSRDQRINVSRRGSDR